MSYNTSPKSFRFSESDESIASLESFVIERDNAQQNATSDEVDQFYAQLSMSFYNHQRNYEKKAPRSAVILKPVSSVDRFMKGKTESLKMRVDAKQQSPVPHSSHGSGSTALSQNCLHVYKQKNILKSLTSNESKKTAQITNKVSPSISVYQSSKRLFKKQEPQQQKQINAQLMKMINTQQAYQDQSIVSESRQSHNSQNKLLKLLYSPYQKRMVTIQEQQNAQQTYVQRQLDLMYQKNLELQQFKTLKKRLNK